MKLLVLYGEQGQIVSLRRVRSDQDATGPAPMRSGVEPAKGQRVEELTVDTPYDDWPLKDLHEQFTVTEEHGRRRLVRRANLDAST